MRGLSDQPPPPTAECGVRDILYRFERCAPSVSSSGQSAASSADNETGFKTTEPGNISHRDCSKGWMQKKPAVPRKPDKKLIRPPSFLLSKRAEMVSDYSSFTSNPNVVECQNNAVSECSQTLLPSSGQGNVQTSSNHSSNLSFKKSASKVRNTAAFFDEMITRGQISIPTSPTKHDVTSSCDRRSSQRSSIISNGSWSDLTDIRIPCSQSEHESSSSDQTAAHKVSSIDNEGDRTLSALDDEISSAGKLSIFGESATHENIMKELRENEQFCGIYERSDNSSSELSNKCEMRPKSCMKGRKITSEPLLSAETKPLFLRHKSDICDEFHGSLPSLCRESMISRCSSAGTAISDFTSDITYSTGHPSEDSRLRKLHFAALEIFTVEKKFVEQLHLIAVQYPAFIQEYGKRRGIVLLKSQQNGQPHLIDHIAGQLLMVMEAHKVLLEKITEKIIVWDSQKPNMAECFKTGSGFLKFCLPYLKEKRKNVDDLLKTFQENDELARATTEFEDQTMGKISIVQQLDIVHQNVVRYNILFDAYKKYLLPDSKEFEICTDALMELSKVSETVDRQISLADMEKRLFDLYRRLEGRFNVFEANRHLLYEGELQKQSRRDVQPRYLILFSDFLLICKYSRTPSLGTDVYFHPDFYKFPVARIIVKPEEHGEYETHFQLYTTEKSAVFIAKTKRERDDWVKRLAEAKKEAKELRKNKKSNAVFHQRIAQPIHPLLVDQERKNDNDISSAHAQISEKYTALWIPDPKATSCMMAGCPTKFGVLNRRHHCRECGWLICRSCVGYAPVKNGSQFIKTKVCPECYVKIASRWVGERDPAIFCAPPSGCLSKTALPGRDDDGTVSGTVYVKNKKNGENEKWGRLFRHSDGVSVLCLYDAEFDAEPVSRHILIGFTLYTQELDDGGRIFELRHCNQIEGNAISIAFRVIHSKNAERWYCALKDGIKAFSTINNNGLDCT